MKKAVPMFLILFAVVAVGCSTQASVSSQDKATISEGSAFARKAAAFNIDMFKQMQEGDTSSARVSLAKSVAATRRGQEALSNVESDPLREFFTDSGEFRLRQAEIHREILDAMDARDFKQIDSLAQDEEEMIAAHDRYVSDALESDLGMSSDEAEDLLGSVKDRQRDLYGEFAD